ASPRRPVTYGRPTATSGTRTSDGSSRASDSRKTPRRFWILDFRFWIGSRHGTHGHDGGFAVTDNPKSPTGYRVLKPADLEAAHGLRAFALDVLNGLSETPKRLSSRWIYDE